VTGVQTCALPISRTMLMVTVEDHVLKGGLYSAVAETLLEHNTICRVLPIGLGARWFKPALLQEVIEHEGFSGEQLASKILTSLQRASGPVRPAPVN